MNQQRLTGLHKELALKPTNVHKIEPKLFQSNEIMQIVNQCTHWDHGRGGYVQECLSTVCSSCEHANRFHNNGDDRTGGQKQADLVLLLLFN